MPPVTLMRIIARLNIGGPAIHVILLTAKLDPTRYHSVLVAGREAPSEGNMLGLAARHGVAPLIIESLGRELSPWGDWLSLWRLYRLMRQTKPAIVHTHTAKAGTVGRLAALLAGVPVRVHTFHGHVFHGYFGPWKTRLFLGIERWLAKRTTRLIAVSRQVRDDLLTLGIGSAATVLAIPLGLDLERFRGARARRGRLRAALGLATDAPLIGIVARLVPIKRHDLFLRAAKRVHEACPQARFVLVGDGELRDAVRGQISALGLEGTAIMAGWRDDLDEVYADLDVVALTSDNEGLPVALIEAMAAGCPIVATDVGGVRELVRDGENGFVVPAGDEAALAARMIELLSAPERRAAMGQAAQERALADYSIERLVGDLDALYRQLLREADAHPGG